MAEFSTLGSRTRRSPHGARENATVSAAECPVWAATFCEYSCGPVVTRSQPTPIAHLGGEIKFYGIHRSLSANRLFVRALERCRGVLVRRLTLLMRSSGVSLGCIMVTVFVSIDSLKMVIGCGDVTGCGQMMVFARRVVLGIRHDDFLSKLSVNIATDFDSG